MVLGKFKPQKFLSDLGTQIPIYVLGIKKVESNLSEWHFGL